MIAPRTPVSRLSQRLSVIRLAAVEAAVSALVLRARSGVHVAREILLDCLPVKRHAVSAAGHARALAINAPSYPTLAHRLEAGSAHVRAAADRVSAGLRDCLPVKRDAETGAHYARPREAQLSRPGVADLARAAMARLQAGAGEARAVLLDCLPVKRGPAAATESAREPSAMPARLSVGERFGALLALVRSGMDDVRAAFEDCLPLKRAPGLPAADARLRARPAPRPAASALRLPYSSDERQVLALLFLPFLLLISALAISHGVRRGPAAVEIATVPHPADEAQRVAAVPGAQLPAVETGPAVAPVPPIEELAPEAPGVSTPAAVPPQVAMLEVPGGEAEVLDDGRARGVCVKTASLAASAAVPAQSLAPTPQAFGMRLAQAARAQVDGFVIYNDRYRSISYPMGDVPFLFGVCTDVVVRAYRVLGLDLQELVQEAKAGSGDRSIDHRRTEVLRRFFAARGQSLPVTSFAEDYLPGDIVTYYRPQNRRTRSHIAIVSDVMAPSGRPMIVHNRGWGPEIEDALFVDQITGHYRYYGPAQKGGLEKAQSTLPSQPLDGGGGTAVAPVSFAPVLKADGR